MLPVFIIFLAACGFSLAAFIHSRKKRTVPIICPMGHSCDPVVRSGYSRFLNVPVEFFGMLYYLLIGVSYLFFFLFPAAKAPWIVIALLGVSALAFLFSLYLVAIQMCILKEWCTWCLISAALCVLIFFSSLRLSSVEVTGIFGELPARQSLGVGGKIRN